MRLAVGLSLSSQKPPRRAFSVVTDIVPTLWWNAAEGITQSGGDVSSWLDKIIARDQANGTQADQPDYGATSFNGYPGITFDGVSDYLTSAGASGLPVSASEGELWTLASQDEVVANGGVLTCFGYGTNGSTHRDIKRSVVGGVNRASASIGASSVTHASVDFSGIHVVRAKFSSGILSIRVDGVEDPTTAAVSPSTGSTRLRVGCIASSGTPSAFWKGGVRDCLVVPVLTEAKTQQLEAYLLHSVGKQTLLPSAHPYRNMAP